MLDVEGTRRGIAALAEAAKTAQPAVRAAVEASIEVSKRALDECEALQADLAKAQKIALEARPHIEALEDEKENAEIRLANLQKAREADQYRARLEKRQRAAKAQALQDARITKAISAATRALQESVSPILDTLIALRARIRDQHGRTVFQNTRKHSHWICKNINGVTIAECETRAEAIALVKRCLALEQAAASKTTLEDLDVSKIGPGINVDLKEPNNQGRQSPGAPASWPPPDLDHKGPRVADDDDETDDD